MRLHGEGVVKYGESRGRRRRGADKSSTMIDNSRMHLITDRERSACLGAGEDGVGEDERARARART